MAILRPNGLRATAILIAASGLWVGSQGAWLYAKAIAAQCLLELAWVRTSAAADHAAPWPWADTWPVARLEMPGAPDLIVLSGVSGRTLAFGPGHMAGSALPGHLGHSVISAHRDTHFRFLRDLRPGSRLRIERPDRQRVDYEVIAVEVMDSEREVLLRNDAPGRWLTLVTCYPFDAVVPGGPLRYLVQARGLAGPGVAAEVVQTRPGTPGP